METFASLAPLVNALRDDGSLDPADGFRVSDELAVALYEHMVLLRLFEERIAACERTPLHRYRADWRGEEATTLGAVAAMDDDDWVFPDGRELAAALWRGVPLGVCALHALGAGRGSRSEGGSQDGSHPQPHPSAPHSWREARVVCGSALGATQVPHAVGAAWAARFRRSEMAALVLFADEATSSSDFHAGLNFAGVTRAPIVAVCCTRGGDDRGRDRRDDPPTANAVASGRVPGAGLAVKAVAYGLAGVRVDGSDVFAVRSVVHEARLRACGGRGGTLVEAVLAPALASVVPSSADIDPVSRMRQHLQARGGWSDDRQQRVAAEMRADVDRAVADALRVDAPERQTLFDDVYAELPWHLKEQRDER